MERFLGPGTFTNHGCSGWRRIEMGKLKLKLNLKPPLIDLKLPARSKNECKRYWFPN